MREGGRRGRAVRSPARVPVGGVPAGAPPDRPGDRTDRIARKSTMAVPGPGYPALLYYPGLGLPCPSVLPCPREAPGLPLIGGSQLPRRRFDHEPARRRLRLSACRRKPGPAGPESPESAESAGSGHSGASRAREESDGIGLRKPRKTDSCLRIGWVRQHRESQESEELRESGESGHSGDSGDSVTF